jgi:hypothetical protein
LSRIKRPQRFFYFYIFQTDSCYFYICAVCAKSWHVNFVNYLTG